MVDPRTPMTIAAKIEKWVQESLLPEGQVMHLGGVRFWRVFGSGPTLIRDHESYADLRKKVSGTFFAEEVAAKKVPDTFFPASVPPDLFAE